VSALIRQNFALLSQKIVERSAELGEHYIARDRAEYGHMLRSAAGGGALTGITTTIKFGITGLHLPGFFEGLFASLNYGVSFIGIQLLGFSLATKQPASTAPAIAAHMERLDAPGQLERLVDEIVHLIRSQVAGILGNVTCVIPATLVFELLARALAGHPLISEEKAAATLGSLSALGPSWIYAAFTGILLWLSSTISGSIDNFFAYRGLSRALLKNRRLIFVFGARGAERISRFFTKNIAGFAANISLGLFLGLLPALLQFVGVPLEVRHVTLATGAIAASVSALGVDCLLSPALWLAVLGVAGIGVLNVAVSFSVALLVAVRARAIAPPGRRRLYAAIRRRFRQEPGSFFYPPAPRRQSLSPPV
jgi:site-specific recombinase